MSYTLHHPYADEALHPTVSRQGGFATVRCSASGLFSARFPGRLLTSATVQYHIRVRVRDPDEEPGGGHGGWGIQTKYLPVTFQIRTPDGEPFTADHVTLTDLSKFRDLRGTSQGSWSYTVSGQSAPIPIEPNESEVAPGYGHLVIALEETVSSRSAPPLVNATLDAHARQRYTFDLWRVGTLVATASAFRFPIVLTRPIRLFDPDGVEVASVTGGDLRFDVTLETLDKSRDAQGNVRSWSLEVLPSSSPMEIDYGVSVSVIGTSRIRTQTLQSRIDELIGVGGSKISVYGEMDAVNARLLGRLKILDPYTAETIDILNLLDPVIRSVRQDEGVNKDIQPNVAYTLVNRSRDLPYELHVSLEGVKVTRIGIVIGASEHLQPPGPALRIELRVEGTATVKIGGFPLATVRVSGNRLALEAGVSINADGTFFPAVWIDPGPIDVEVHWAAAVAAGVLSFGLLLLGADGLAEYVQHELNDKVVKDIQVSLAHVMSMAPHVLAIVHGAHLTYRSVPLEGDDIVFVYVAPLEPEPRPFQDYLGIIGRSAIQLGPHAWQLIPRSLGDTWSVPNLRNKIDHIVIVMMENRSFDHVLGYRAQLRGAQNADGLTDELLTFLGSPPPDGPGFTIRRLNESNIPRNALGLKTRFPIQVGHRLKDMIQQYSERLVTPSSRTIVSPKGFVDNFADRASATIPATDVLGYYVGSDLPMARFLADNYAYCERYFASHLGPTLPNRMYSLTGDVQYDRTGEAILDNSIDSFQLSRALTMFDLLTRKRIGWRVYESFPSVTMLRMFARYSTDDTQIVRLSQLQNDVANGTLPAVAMIEPAMHHAPENDDHPVADMYNGQLFLKTIYDTLRSNSALWRRTLLIITYDEHGGFYDHVVPPMAEVRMRPIVISEGAAPSGREPFTAPTLVTHYGGRVPTFVVSPWTPAGEGPDVVLDHCSIAKTVLARFCGEAQPFVSDRINASRTFEAYVSAEQPRMNVAASPAMQPLPFPRRPGGPRAIETPPVSRRQMARGDADFHDVTGMLARLLGR
jgi:phospholipase C